MKNSANCHTIYLGLGTNNGDRLANLEAAIQSLSPDVTVTRRSPIYRTPPWGYTDQPDFLNMVLEAETELPPFDLLKYLKDLEVEIGRTKTFRWGPREIDIDILLYENQTLETADLTIPHPQMQNRAFVLVPLADLAPDLRHPILGKSVDELKNTLDLTGIHPFDPNSETER